jgi:hypothetical protein
MIEKTETSEEEAEQSQEVQRWVMPLGEWAENVCPKLAREIETHAWECLKTAATRKEMDIFIRCCMASIRQGFDKGA